MLLRCYKALTAVGEQFGLGYVAGRIRTRRNSIRGFPACKNQLMFIKKSHSKTLWFHAASVGETMCIIPLVNLALTDKPDIRIVITCSSASALTIAPRGDRITSCLVPLDLPDEVDRFISALKPDVAVWVESEFWPHLLEQCQSSGAFMLLLNGRLSNKSYYRWTKYGRNSFHQLLSCFDVIIPRTQTDLERIQSFGNITCETPVDIKADLQGVKAKYKKILGRRGWVAGSTHQEEGRVVCEVHQLLLQGGINDIITIIAPRHFSPNLVSIVSELCPSSMLYHYSEMKSQYSCPVSFLNDQASPAVVIVDTIGDLADLYSAVDVAFVGGSLSEMKWDHNCYEPRNAGCSLVLQGDVGACSSFVQVVDNCLQLATFIQLKLSRTKTDPTHVPSGNGAINKVWAMLKLKL